MNYLRTLLAAALLPLSGAVLAQTGGVTIGAATAPDPSAVLDLRSSSQGLLLPRLTLVQRNALTASTTAPPVPGLVIYQTDNTPGLYAYDGTGWVRLGADNLGNHTATQALNLQGNALTGTGDNLGTAVGLGIRADGGLNLGQNTSGRNVFIGYQSGQATTGTQNQFVGWVSGVNNTTGSYNYFAGPQSGFNNTTGSYNYFAGPFSGQVNTTGSANYFSGYASGNRNVTGSNNHFVGFQSGLLSTGSNNHFEGFDSGLYTTTGSNNHFVGFQSGANNTTGSNNHFEGYQGGGNNTTGNNNHFEGYQSGGNNATGNNNLFLGYQSGVGNFTGNNNWAVGYLAGPTSANLTNAGALGYQAQVDRDNSLVLGGTGANAVQVGIGTTAPSQLLELAGQAGPSLLLHSNTNNVLTGGTLQFRESDTAYGWNLRHNTGATEDGSADDRLVLERLNGAGSTPVMAWNQATGRVGIGTTAPAATLDVAGTAAFNSTAATTAAFASTATDPDGVLRLTVPATNSNCNTCSEYVAFFKAGTSTFIGSIYANLSGNAVVYGTASDRRLKEHITPTHFGLADLLKLRVKDYNFIGQPATARTTGLLAQDLFQVYPDAVKQGDGGPVVRDAWAVDYGRLTPLLIQAIQDQQAQMEALRAEAAGQRQRADRAEAAVGNFEQRLRALEAAGARAEAGR